MEGRRLEDVGLSGLRGPSNPYLVAPVRGGFVSAITVSVVHFAAMSALTPKLVGNRARLNALSVTTAMMFWGWLRGAMGLILAVPIMAAVKAVCDNVPLLHAVGRWIGEER